MQDNLEDISGLVKKGLTEALDFIINADIDPKLKDSSLLKKQKRMAQKKQYLVDACRNTEQFMESNTVCRLSFHIYYKLLSQLSCPRCS